MSCRRYYEILQIARQQDAVKNLEKDLKVSQNVFKELQEKSAQDVCKDF